MSMTDFFTRDVANEGKRVPLTFPDGKKSNFFLVVRSQWSDAYQSAKSEAMQRVAAAVAAGEVDVKAIVEEQKLHALSALVAGWNLPEEFTPENVVTFLRNAPQVASAVDKMASNDRRFFANGSATS